MKYGQDNNYGETVLLMALRTPVFADSGYSDQVSGHLQNRYISND